MLEVILPETGCADVLLLAGQHGDEPETTVLLSAAVRTILSSHLKCAVVLCANPDGLARGTRANAAGVDLNRNFPALNWASAPIVYRWSSQDPRDVVLSPGCAAASEPETRAMLSLLAMLQPSTVISLHAPLACVDDPSQSYLARWLSEASGLPLVTDIGYPTPGSFGTWAGENGVTLITLELPHASIESLRHKLGPILEKLLLGECW